MLFKSAPKRHLYQKNFKISKINGIEKHGFGVCLRQIHPLGHLKDQANFGRAEVLEAMMQDGLQPALTNALPPGGANKVPKPRFSDMARFF